MARKLVLAGLVLIGFTAVLLLKPAFAAVTLVSFTATPIAENTLKVEWQTATEMDVLAFRLYRAQAEFPTDWGSPLSEQPHLGDSIIGATYTYTDTAVAHRVKYWYLLEEVTSNGPNAVKKISAGIDVPTDTPTPTATTSPTVRPTATRTSAPAGGITPTKPAPTATQKYTNTPVISPLGTPTRPPATAAAQARPPTATPLPVARIATPTGQVPVVAAPAAALPTVVSVLPTPLPAAIALAPSPSSTLSISDKAETATPIPTREDTPVVFVAQAKPATAAAETTEQVASGGSQSTSLALVIGGSLVGFAALLAAVLLFLRSRKS